MTHSLREKDVFDDVARLDVLSNIRSDLGLPIAEYPTVIASPLSIGIEIEMIWRQAFPEVAKQWPSPSSLDKKSREYATFSAAYDKEDSRMKQILKIVQKIIPRVGLDAYWEFSFLPTKNLAVTQAESGLLYELGILRPDNEYALHMTVAGIDNDRDAYAFLCALEQNGGTSVQRIQEAIISKKGAWARKGMGGLRRRASSELLGEDTVGYEFRTLSVQSNEQLKLLLETAAILARLWHDDNEAWQSHRAGVERNIRGIGLSLAPWPRPKADPQHWSVYADSLDKIK